jgi:hypothetical protein
VPLTESLDDLRWRGPNVELLGAFCERVGDKRLLESAQSTYNART